MNTVRLSGHAFQLSQRVQRFARELFARLGLADRRDLAVDVVVDHSAPRRFAVSATVHDLPGGALHVNGSAPTVYAALRQAAQRARTRFARHHDRALGH